MQNMADSNFDVNILASPGVVGSDNMNGINYDSSKMGMDYDLSGGVPTEGTYA